MREYTEPTDEVGRALLLAARAVLTEAETDALRGLCATVGQRRLRAAAVDSRCEALIGCGVRSVLGEDFDPDWQACLRNNETRVAALTETLLEVLLALHAEGCRTAVIEGGGTLFGTTLPPAAYGAGDVDVLVDTDHWTATCRVMKSLGFVPQDRRGRPTKRIEYRRPDSDQWVEVGCQPFDRMWVPLVYRDACDDWLSRRIVSPTHRDVFVLEPTDAVVLAAFHSSLHSFVRSPGLRLHVDVDRSAREPAVDWDEFTVRVTRMGTRTRTYVALMLARSLLGTPIPARVLDELNPGPARWGLIASLLGRAGVLANDRRKLPGWEAMLLDLLIDDRGPAQWAGSVILPDERWLREHFTAGANSNAPTLRLHLERYRLAMTKWRREVQ